MIRVARRPFTMLIPVLLTAVLGACTTATAAPPSPVPTDPIDRPAPVAVPTRTPAVGNVDSVFPELAVEQTEEAYVVSVTDPAAKAWEIAVAGTGPAATDRLELVVEVGDTAPGASVRVIVGGLLVDTLEFGSMIGVATAAAGGCHPTLEICLSSGDISIDPESGTLSVRLEDLGGRGVAIRGATAEWPGEPFILGPWRETAIFGQ